VRNSKSIVFIAALVVLLLGPAAASAKQPAVDVRIAQADVNIAPRQAASIARGATNGRVLSVKLSRSGNPFYRVKVLLAGGRVRTVLVDATTGQLLN
jgi:uncharacterized membrane protein YkoI